MNNMMLPSALYLKDKGYKVTLFLLNEFDHFSPQADTNNEIDIEIIKLGWKEDNFSDVSRNTIINVFKGYDFFIGTDYSAAFLNKANIQLDIYFPAGTDLSEWPFKQSKRTIPYRWEFNITLCSIAQFKGIRQANYLAIDPTNKEYEEKIIKIRGNATHTENIPYHYLPFFQNITELIDDNLIQLKHQISTFDFKIIQHGRQEWTMPENSDHYKGNERLIKGFNAFIKETNSKSCLILLEYGSDVQASKQLIKELGIENHVIWLPKMLRKYLFHFLTISDVGIGSFGRSWYSSCAVYEILMASLPLIAYRDIKLYEKHNLYPLLNANSDNEIAYQLINSYNNKVELKNIGKLSYQWLLKKQEKRVNNILRIIDEKEKSYSLIKKLIEKIVHFPFYLLKYQLLKPLSWMIEFYTVRLTNNKLV